MTDPIPGHERYRDWLSIPYLGGDDQPLGLRFRCLQNHNCKDWGHGKYQSMSGVSDRLFNVRAVLNATDTLEITEGEFDTMILSSLGLHSVALPGANTWKPYYRRVCAGFSTVRIWGDPDEPGAELVSKITQSLRRARAMRLTVGDVTDTYLAGGETALRAVIEREASY